MTRRHPSLRPLSSLPPTARAGRWLGSGQVVRCHYGQVTSRYNACKEASPRLSPGASWRRPRYDAEVVVSAFTTRLQQTVDLDALPYDLVGVTEDAFQPAHVSMWLAPVTAGEEERRPA